MIEKEVYTLLQNAEEMVRILLLGQMGVLLLLLRQRRRLLPPRQHQRPHQRLSVPTLTATTALTTTTENPQQSSSSPNVAIIVGAVSSSIIVLLLIILLKRKENTISKQKRQVLPRVVNDDETKLPYENVNTGRDGYEVPRNIHNFEMSIDRAPDVENFDEFGNAPHVAVNIPQILTMVVVI